MENKRKIIGFISLLLGVLMTLAPTVRALEIIVSENGSGSDNTVETQVESTETVNQNNDAEVLNNVETNADTGNNTASDNTGADVSIDTGDIESTVFVENALNSSSAEVGCCPDDTNLKIDGNGTDSTNEIKLNDTSGSEINISQEANVYNNVNGTANTGNNTANDNTGGDVSIETGDIYAGGGITNGPINVTDVEAGGGGSDVNAKISGNGSSSTNNIFASLNNNNNVNLNFLANIRNDVNWDLNTGGNSANGNTGGSTSIITGDIFFDFFIKNGPINFGSVIITCCDSGDRGGPGDPGDPGDPGNPGDPGDTGGAGGGGGDGGGDGGTGGSVGSEAASIIGLSDTSSEAAKALLFWVGVAMVLYGAKTIGGEILPGKVYSGASKKKG